MKNDAYTLGLVGKPVSHSLSPLLHSLLFETLNLKCTYIAHEVNSQDLRSTIEKIKALNYRGFNVTYPYKRDIIKYLDEIDESAKLIGAVNTVKYDGQKLIGYNTDGIGFIRSMADKGKEIKNRRVCILGAGGASRAIAVNIALQEPANITVLNRTVSKAAEVCNIINNNIKDIAQYGSIKEIQRIENSDIIINTTPLGMIPYEDRLPIEGKIQLSEDNVVYDIIYNPPQTKLLKLAEDFGCVALNGLGMLIYQGISSEEIWLDIQIPDHTANLILKQMRKLTNF